MSATRGSIEVKTSGPSYLGWRGELLAELALVRVAGLSVHKRTKSQPAGMPFDFLVCTEHGFCFFVVVRAFLSIRLGIECVETVGELRCSLDAGLIRQARENYNPVILFLFDADNDHGRFLRLDDLLRPDARARHLTVRLSVENVINRDSVEKLVVQLELEARRLAWPLAGNAGPSVE
jgi:hypothetical protein